MAVLHNISNDIVNAINHYYLLLSKTGYISQCKVESLLVFTFIENFLNDYDSIFTDDDYELLNKVVECLSGNCLIPYSDKYGLYDGQNNISKLVEKIIRIDENSTPRNTEQSEIRLKS